MTSKTKIRRIINISKPRLVNSLIEQIKNQIDIGHIQAAKSVNFNRHDG
jgi:hypothetical protein